MNPGQEANERIQQAIAEAAAEEASTEQARSSTNDAEASAADASTGAVTNGQPKSEPIPSAVKRESGPVNLATQVHKLRQENPDITPAEIRRVARKLFFSEEQPRERRD